MFQAIFLCISPYHLITSFGYWVGGGRAVSTVGSSTIEVFETLFFDIFMI